MTLVSGTPHPLWDGTYLNKYTPLEFILPVQLAKVGGWVEILDASGQISDFLHFVNNSSGTKLQLFSGQIGGELANNVAWGGVPTVAELNTYAGGATSLQTSTIPVEDLLGIATYTPGLTGSPSSPEQGFYTTLQSITYTINSGEVPEAASIVTWSLLVGVVARLRLLPVP